MTATAITKRTVLNIALSSAALFAAPSIAAASAVSLTVSAAIDRYLTAEANDVEAYLELDDAEGAAAKEHGHRPSELILWRDRHIGRSEIEDMRARLLSHGRDTLAEHFVDSWECSIEAEYLDARKRIADKIKRAREWSRKAGTAHLEKRKHAASFERFGFD